LSGSASSRAGCGSVRRGRQMVPRGRVSRPRTACTLSGGDEQGTPGGLQRRRHRRGHHAARARSHRPRTGARRAVDAARGSLAAVRTSTSQESHVAMAVYAVVLEGMALSFSALFEWSLGEGHSHLKVPVEQRRSARVRSSIGVLVYAGSSVLHSSARHGRLQLRERPRSTTCLRPCPARLPALTWRNWSQGPYDPARLRPEISAMSQIWLRPR